jgi:hypothetical protein
MSDTEDFSRPENRRSFYRIEARLPVRLTALDPGEAAAVALELTTSRETGLDIEDLALRAAFQRLERKLELVLAHLDRGRPQPLTRAASKRIDLSASGVAVEDAEDSELGDEVLIEFQLPGDPPRHVRAIGHVAGERSGSARGKITRAFAFDVIAEQDREAIVRFSHDVQRRELRKRRRRGHSP